MDEKVKQPKKQAFVESLDQSDAAQLERLGHHGISGALNRNQEEDVSLQHQYENSSVYRKTHHQSSGLLYTSDYGWSSNPLASLWLSLSVVFICGCMIFTSLQKPIERQPASIRLWPTVIADVVHTVVHNGRHTSYDYTFEYKVKKKVYRFTENYVSTALDMSEVKYDPQIPSHYFRVPLEAEGIVITLIASLGVLLGLSFAWDAIARWRRGYASKLGPTTATIALAASITMLPIAFYISHTANAVTPYSTANAVASK